MLFSVVTPSLNQGQYLGDTLSSVREAAERAAGAHEVEHIVADAGSTDGSLETLKGQAFARWWSRPDGGQADAVNQGWAEAKGEVLSFLCSDDLWEPETVRWVGDAFDAHPEADVVYGDYYFMEGDSGWKRRKEAGPHSVGRLQKDNFLSQPATFLRRRVWEKFGPLDASLRYCMDYEYWLRINRSVSWLYLPVPVAVMRQHADSKTNAQLTKAWWETARMARRYGEGRRFWFAALKMQLGGQLYYAAKRRYFRALGRKAAK